MLAFLPRNPWLLQTSGFLLLLFLCTGDGDHATVYLDAAPVGSITPFPYPISSQAIGGTQSNIPSVIFFNTTGSLTCDKRERTPGYITTIFLLSSPFVFGCLSSDTSSYYFSVALSGANFPNTPIWLANRYHPVKENASFSLTPQGSVVLRDFDGTQVWSSGTDRLNPTGLLLTPEGNLILFDELNKTLWQSFSEPVDLLVPGQFLNPGQSLVAGFSSLVSRTGSFSANMTEGGLIFYENSASQALPYFALGYPLVLTTPETLLNSPCNHTRLDVTELNMTQVQTVPSPSCKLSSPSMPSSVSFESSIVFIRLETNGILKGYYPDHKPAYDVLRNVRDGNVSKGTCRIPNACGPYGICENSQCRCPGDNNSSISTLFNNSSTKEYLLTSTLCNLKVPVTCNHSGDVEQQYLVDVGSVDYFANDLIEPTMLAGSFDECKQACQRNCTCQASFYRRKSKHCYLHESVFSMIQMNDGGYMGAIKVQRSKENSRNLGIGLIASICIVTALLLIAVIGTYFFFYHRKRWRGGMKAGLDKDDVELLASLPGQPRRFSYKELQDATWDFSQKLGAGGFGSVYKGVFSDGSIVAVKKLENTAKFTQGMKEFRNEVITLSNINHQNLVHLKGFCADGGHRLLVYEYVSNGSLDSWLFLRGGHQGRTLDWKTRLSIAVQTARGLSFLHEQCRNRIVHLDIKPQNILLDDNFSPKLSDFGLSQLINEDQDSAVTRMRGTPGYMAPECLVLTDATEKSDVYSFGMVLLEIVSGRKNVDISRLTVHGDEEGWYFPALASRKFKDGKALDIVDKNIMPLKNEELAEVTRVLKTAFWCIQDNPSLRPSMGKVVLILEGYSNVAQPPLSFSFGKRFHLSNTISTNPQSPIDGSPRHNTFDKPEHALGNGNHHDEAQWKEKEEDNGEQEGAMYHSSHVQSLHSSAHSSHHASPHASPLPTLLSHNSLPHSAFRQASPCQSPSSNAASAHILTSQRISPVHLSPVSSPH